MITVPPFYFVTLTHSNWNEALTYAKSLPLEAMPELRLDLFPDRNPEEMVVALKRRCLITCRRASDGGNWHSDEAKRLKCLLSGLRGRPAWIDLEWDVSIPSDFLEYLTDVNLLRSVHVEDGICDLEQRLVNMPPGDAFKWVGYANSLTDNAVIKKQLTRIKSKKLIFTAFLTGNKGIISRCMQAAWGGAFTYAHPDNALPAAPGQIALSNMRKWRCDQLHADCGLCGVMGDPVMHSLGPNYHNIRFVNACKNLLYLPLECKDPLEAKEAIESLDIVGVSLTSPLKELLPVYFGFVGPLNTLWRQRNQSWQGTNTDLTALDNALQDLQPGPVLVLGDGGVAKTTQQALLHRGWPCLLFSRRSPLTLKVIRDFNPIGVVQATRLGMNHNDPIPFPDVMTNIKHSLRWGIEWIYKENTAFANWIKGNGYHLVFGKNLFDMQAYQQSIIFMHECS